MDITKKKVKRLCTFRECWLDEYSWIQPTENKNRVYCIICEKDFGVSYGGKNDVKRHEEAKTHQKMSLTFDSRVKTEVSSTKYITKTGK